MSQSKGTLFNVKLSKAYRYVTDEILLVLQGTNNTYTGYYRLQYRVAFSYLQGTIKKLQIRGCFQNTINSYLKDSIVTLDYVDLVFISKQFFEELKDSSLRTIYTDRKWNSEKLKKILPHVTNSTQLWNI
jgi:hypothetical protein